MNELIKMERKGWEALSSSKEASQNYYNSILHQDAMMMFPGGMQVKGKENILKSISSQPWYSFEIKNTQIISVSNQVKILTYRVNAQRKGSDLYEALISSTYILVDNKWKLIFHQQTPA